MKLNSTQNFASIVQHYLEDAERYPRYKDSAQKWVNLIRHLEQLDGPPQWVTISGGRGCFYMTEIETWEPTNARVEVYRHTEGYEIHYRSPEAQAPWPSDAFKWWGTWIIGIAPNVEVAGRMVIVGLERAATNLPQNRLEARARYG